VKQREGRPPPFGCPGHPRDPPAPAGEARRRSPPAPHVPSPPRCREPGRWRRRGRRARELRPRPRRRTSDDRPWPDRAERHRSRGRRGPSACAPLAVVLTPISVSDRRLHRGVQGQYDLQAGHLQQPGQPRRPGQTQRAASGACPASSLHQHAQRRGVEEGGPAQIDDDTGMARSVAAESGLKQRRAVDVEVAIDLHDGPSPAIAGWRWRSRTGSRPGSGGPCHPASNRASDSTVGPAPGVTFRAAQSPGRASPATHGMLRHTRASARTRTCPRGCSPSDTLDTDHIPPSAPVFSGATPRMNPSSKRRGCGCRVVIPSQSWYPPTTRRPQVRFSIEG